MGYNIAIDGPAGAGKSTVAKLVAKQLNFIYVDTGAMYRAIGLLVKRNQVNVMDEKKVEEILTDADISIEYVDGFQQVLLNAENVSSQIRTEEVGRLASAAAKLAVVRAKLLDLQRDLAVRENVVMDGRDIGTNVLPHAEIKLFLTASSLVRAQRRFKELSEKGEVCNLSQIQQDMEERDKQDMEREIAPLRQAKDALYLDCSNLTLDESVEAVLSIYNKLQKGDLV